MFAEGHGGPKASKMNKAVAKPTNALVLNAIEAVKELWKERGYDSKYPEETKRRLGYALDREEAVGYALADALGHPIISPVEARTLGKRANTLASALNAKLAKLRKRGSSGAADRATLLHSAATLNMAPPPPQKPPPAAALPPAPAPSQLSLRQPMNQSPVNAAQAEQSAAAWDSILRDNKICSCEAGTPSWLCHAFECFATEVVSDCRIHRRTGWSICHCIHWSDLEREIHVEPNVGAYPVMSAGWSPRYGRHLSRKWPRARYCNDCGRAGTWACHGLGLQCLPDSDEEDGDFIDYRPTTRSRS